MAEIEKNIAFFIQSQFPAIYRENGQELVSLIEEYYNFLETDTKQTHYNSRRIFDYRDIDTTLESMIIFFQKKFLADLPLNDSDSVRFIVKNILDLYRRKGTPAGIQLFFALFFDEYEAQISYPARYMLKVSNSKWKNGVYLQMVPNKNKFFGTSGAEYSYQDLLGRTIIGSSSGAQAAVDKINFVILNNILTPIIYLDEVLGTFQKFDDIITNINGEVVSFGRIAGSLDSVVIDDGDAAATTGHKVGDIYKVKTSTGRGGEVVVTKVTDDISGEINYTIEDGGYGYTIDNTRLVVSNQSILFKQAEFEANQEDLTFEPYERIRDFAGNIAQVVGQSGNVLGVKHVEGSGPHDEFSINRLPLLTMDRDTTLIIDPSWVGLISQKNDSSPGDMYVDTADDADVKVLALGNPTNVDVITDLIAPHLATVLNIADYEVNAPFSGTASPVNLSTPLNQAFDIQTLTIGSIEEFENINPGSEYTFDVFALAKDDLFSTFKRKSQLISFLEPSSAGLFDVGSIIEEAGTGIRGEVKAINVQKGFISVVAFDYYGFTGSPIIRANGNVTVSGVSTDYDSPILGQNAVIDAETEFAIGKISEVRVVDSGFGYVTGQSCTIEDTDEQVHAVGVVSAETQGKTGGFWSDFSSHINGFEELPQTLSTPILPTDDLADYVQQVYDGIPTAPPEIGLWAGGSAADSILLFDFNESANSTFTSISNTDIQTIRDIAEGNTQTPQYAIDRWNDVISPSIKQQVWFRNYPNLYEYQNSYEYYDSGMKIQDSDFYQEYSYQIKSTLGRREYERLLKENVHLAGTKMFGDFQYTALTGSPPQVKFLRLMNSITAGSPLDEAPVSGLTADIVNYYVDATIPTADHEPPGTGLPAIGTTSGPQLTLRRNWSQGFHDYTVTVGMPSAGAEPYPVAILLHGNGGNANSMVQSFTSTLPGHILIGIDGYEQSWNVTNEVSKGPDIQMLRDMVDQLKVYRNVDATKIRIVGVSNGGALALRASVEISDLAVDTIASLISQAHDDQYRGGNFYYPSNHQLTGSAYTNAGYDTLQGVIPQRKILQMNGSLDVTVPYAGGAGVANTTFLSAADSAYALGQKQGWAQAQLANGTTYGTESTIIEYDDVVFLTDTVGHTVSADMENLLNKFLEDNYNTNY